MDFLRHVSIWTSTVGFKKGWRVFLISFSYLPNSQSFTGTFRGKTHRRGIQNAGSTSRCHYIRTRSPSNRKENETLGGKKGYRVAAAEAATGRATEPINAPLCWLRRSRWRSEPVFAQGRWNTWKANVEYEKKSSRLFIVNNTKVRIKHNFQEQLDLTDSNQGKWMWLIINTPLTSN